MSATARGGAGVQPRLLNWVLAGAAVAIALSYSIFLAVDALTAEALSQEDALVEDLGALFSLLASLLLVLCYFSSAGKGGRFFGRKTKGNLWFLALAALMFVCFGEEISWGQRVFGWGTPPALQEVNAQGETNLHNLWLFQATNPDGSHKSSLGLLLNANRLYSIFWLSYCVLLPLLVHASDTFRRLAVFFGIPIPFLGVGSLFVTNYALFLTIVAFGQFDRETISAFDELKESLYAFCYVVLAVYFLDHYRRV